MRQLAEANLEIGFDVYFCENMPSGQGSWFVRGFERFGDGLLSEQPLTGVDDDVLTDFIRNHWADLIRKHWTRPGDEDDPSLLLCISYPLTPGDAEALREQVGVEANLDFSREEYFLEYNV
jgi:hypothetical protein